MEAVTKEKELGLALSGGGHRAAVFALGALLYLVDSARNRDVTVVSSVSGGSITNAFIATLQTKFRDQRPEQFDPEAARLAQQIAGRPRWWGASWALLALLVAAGTVVRFIDLSPRASEAIYIILAFGALALSRYCGPRSAGTLWGWWGTWLYVELLIMLVLGLIDSIFLSRSPFGVILAFLLLAVMASLRNKVAEFAFDATINPTQERAVLRCRRRLCDLAGTVRHVFCATELHSGRHAYFSHDLFYVPFAGLAEPGDLRVSTAVQTSANFPGGFPFRRLAHRHPFIGLPMGEGPKKRPIKPGPAVLTDGGVYDNTGASWFLEAYQRPDLAHDLARWKADALYGRSSGDQQRVLTQLQAMQGVPAQLIVINSIRASRMAPAFEVVLNSTRRRVVPVSRDGRRFLRGSR